MSNGLAEVTNLTILEGLKQKVAENMKNWPDMLDEVLWAYRTTPREATGHTPYSLVYGMKAVTPFKLVESSLRMVTYEREANCDARVAELDMVDEAREEAWVCVIEYQIRVKKTFDKHVAPRHFQPGDLVLRKVEAIRKKMAKLDLTWKGPFQVVSFYGNGEYTLETPQGTPVPRTWNVVHLHKFYTNITRVKYGKECMFIYFLFLSFSLFNFWANVSSRGCPYKHPETLLLSYSKNLL